MRCPECGEYLPDDANFCIRCGVALRTGQPSVKPSCLSRQSRDAIVAALLEHGKSLGPTQPSGLTFTPLTEADSLIRSDPFAFLVAVICDQGVKAERAWEVPYKLRQRLGHLDPKRIAAEPEAVFSSVKADPSRGLNALVRYVNITPGWIVEAARTVVDRYSGDAGAIWGDKPAAAKLQDRLLEFKGIGQKKAAMAVEILERDLHIPIRELPGSDIAYDVHIRRVLLRTCFVEHDEIQEMVASARQAYPSRPGALDLPAWAIGREYCRPTAPNCVACPLGSVCPKEIDRASGVKGA